MPPALAVALPISILAHAGLCAEFDWPQWQGPDCTSHSRETGLLKDWPTNGPPLAWKITGLAGGDSAPSVAASRIYGSEQPRRG